MAKVFGKRYQVSGKVGSGGMAEVYKAYDPVLDRTVAIKVLHPHYAQEENFVARFRREAQAAANLNHPNIVNIYDWGTEDGTYFIVMEYLEGKSLKQLIDEKGALIPSMATDIAEQVLNGLEAAHAHDVVHRDIKPHNIIITPDGKVKVTDFGIARAGASSALTQTGSIVGTAQYVSPEQAQGLPAEAQSDLYSLGIVLYEMLTGEVPFEGENPVSVAVKQINEAPRSPRSLNPSIPKSLEAIVLKALAKDPAQRYQSAYEMKEDLQRYAQGLPVKKPRLSKAEKADFNGKTIVMPTQKPGEYRKATRKKRRVLPWIALVIVMLAMTGVGAWAIYNFVIAKTITVPNVVGKSVESAREIVEEEGLRLEEKERVFSDTIAADNVISQDPEEGEKLRRGGVVEVIVSGGTEIVEVPDVVGKSVEQATYLLPKAGLELGDIKKVYSSEPENEVISQDPEAGDQVKKATQVDLVVSRGEKQVSVPDVTNKTFDEAKSSLEQAGFKVERTDESSGGVDEGNVIRTSPAAGTEAKKGSTVSVVVSTGPESVDVPDVIGDSESVAEAKLEDAGFTVVSKDVNTNPSNMYNKVTRQSPSAGTSLDEGSSVTIWVGRNP